MNIALAAEEATKTGINLNAWDAIWAASPVVKLTLLTLIGLSVFSWAIIFAKKKQFKLITQDDEKFVNDFWKSQSLDKMYNDLEDYPFSVNAKIFHAGFNELQKLAQNTTTSENSKPTLSRGIDNIERALRKSTDIEISKIENKLGFLATTGSTSPFIGLFGTVWGIMGSFQQIGATGAAHLAVVAPGISEALIATAIGLAVAIPAVIAYNHYIQQLKKIEMDMNNFSSDFLNVTKRNFFKER